MYPKDWAHGHRVPKINLPSMEKIGRNAECPCGSLKKFKHCHGAVTPHGVSAANWRVREIRDAPPDVQAMARGFRKENIADSFSGPRPIKIDHQGYTFRAVGNRLYYREKHRTYVDFLLELVKFAFGPKWHKEQVSLPEPHRHVVMQWMGSWYRHCSATRPKDLPSNTVFASAPTGDGQALLTFADDLYRLQLAQSLTSRLMRRLRIPGEFQGARYEIQVASIFLRSGFEVEWREAEKNKHCEFLALHRHTRHCVAVEAKSRKRPGVLGNKGRFQHDHPFGIEQLYNDARSQNPGNCPFCIFIDVNWPLCPGLPRFQKPWMGEMFRWAEAHVPTRENPDTVALSALTNYAWHYQGSESALPHETLFSLPRYATHPFPDVITRDALLNSIVTYGTKIEESPTPMIRDEVIEQLAAM